MPATKSEETATFVERLNTLSQLDLGYLAGVIEGEGAIDLHRGRYPRVRVSMTDRDVVGKVADVLGATVQLTLSPAPHKPVWTTGVTGPRADAVLRALLPYMSARRSSQIATVLAGRIERRVAAGIALTRPPLYAEGH